MSINITEGPKVIRPETQQHDVLWVAVVTDGSSGEPKRQADAFARTWAQDNGYSRAACVTMGASCEPRTIEWRYGYSLAKPLSA